MSYRDVQKYCKEHKQEIEKLEGHDIRCTDKLVILTKYVERHKGVAKSQNPPIRNPKIPSKYTLVSKIGHGGFSDVYKAKINKTKEEVAIKITKAKLSTASAIRELQFLTELQGIPGIPLLYSNDINDKKAIIVMQLLGSSLNTTQLPISTNAIARRVLRILERIHNRGILHLDIKPANIVFGHDDDTELYIIDFGVSEHYLTKNGKHRPFRTDHPFRGTYEYASEYVMKKIEPSRRDDLISLGYTLASLYIDLPWKNAVKKMRMLPMNKRKSTKKEIIDIKEDAGDLRDYDVPQNIVDFLDAVLYLDYDESPDYKKYKELFRR